MIVNAVSPWYLHIYFFNIPQMPANVTNLHITNTKQTKKNNKKKKKKKKKNNKKNPIIKPKGGCKVLIDIPLSIGETTTHVF